MKDVEIPSKLNCDKYGVTLTSTRNKRSVRESETVIDQIPICAYKFEPLNKIDESELEESE